jgi:deazaflavin-dependent oxidoreductase (nitroreductase family)
MTRDTSALARELYCYLTTTGRVSGQPRTIEIWFALEPDTVYMLAGSRERAHWVQNALRNPDVTLRINDATFQARARKVGGQEEDALARRLLFAKYSPTDSELDEWAKTALPMAFDLVAS